jgi:hypothetical protein
VWPELLRIAVFDAGLESAESSKKDHIFWFPIVSIAAEPVAEI